MNRRVVFISASYLSQTHNYISPDIMNDAIFFFGSKRSWIFPKNQKEKDESLRQPTKYLAFSDEFKKFILLKEQQGLVCWLKPDENYSKVSDFFATIDDPITGQKYHPLILDAEWWLTAYHPIFGRYDTDPEMVIRNFIHGEHMYAETMELLFQSNPTLEPVLFFKNHN